MTDSTEEPKKTVDSDDDGCLKIVETLEPKAHDPPPLSPVPTNVKKEELKPSNQDEEEKAPILKAEEPSKPPQILRAVETTQSKATSLPTTSAPPTSSTSTTLSAPTASTQRKPRTKSKKTTKKPENQIAVNSSFAQPMFPQAFNQNGNTYYPCPPMIRSTNGTGVSTAIRYQQPGGGSFYLLQNPPLSQQSTPIIVSQQHQLPSTSTITVQSKPKTSEPIPQNLVPLVYANGNANWKPQNSNPYIIKPPIVSTSVASTASTSSTLPNGDLSHHFLIPYNPPPNQRLVIARTPDGNQQLMQISSWSKGSATSDCPPPPTLSPNPSTSTSKPQKKLPKLTPEAPPADPQIKLNAFNDDAMESAEDDQPPQIDREDGNERNLDQRNSTAQKTKIAFADAAHVHHQLNGSTPRVLKHYVDNKIVEEELNSLPPTKQRKLAQPPFSIASDESTLRQIAQHQVKWVSTPKNGSSTAANGTVKPNRAVYVQPHPPPVIRPANYQPEPKKEAPPSPKRDSKSLVGRSPAITKPPVTTSSSEPVAVGGSQRKRGRPTKPEIETPNRFVSLDDAASSKRIKSAGSTPTENVVGRTRKNREVEGLLNMDFGPGKTPFQTTNPQLFTENVLTSRERIQSHVGNDDGRTSRASETSQRADRRRQNSVVSTSSGRPRRFAQSNVAYSKMLDGGLESEDDYKQEEEDNPRMLNNQCIICGKSPTNPSFPQYCDKNCQMAYKKRRVESMAQLLTNSPNESTVKKSPKISTPQPPNSSAGELDLLRSVGIQNWTATQTARWAELVSGSSEVGQKFLEQEIDGAALLFLNESQLKSELGLKLGPMIKLVRDLNELKKNEPTR
ncbi:hypothetical protein M3Y94_00930900 [Aphelenchoides besseyi]|nr:hypothetical protein M3Y94_00930900 [Aphelenchoides besseyi]KAI6224993.1 Polyhomeotic distal [Aphelenchoides besseyi]